MGGPNYSNSNSDKYVDNKLLQNGILYKYLI